MFLAGWRTNWCSRAHSTLPFVFWCFASNHAEYYPTILIVVSVMLRGIGSRIHGPSVEVGGSGLRPSVSRPQNQYRKGDGALGNSVSFVPSVPDGRRPEKSIRLSGLSHAERHVARVVVRVPLATVGEPGVLQLFERAQPVRHRQHLQLRGRTWRVAAGGI
jgi:hypothetical protein